MRATSGRPDWKCPGTPVRRCFQCWHLTFCVCRRPESRPQGRRRAVHRLSRRPISPPAVASGRRPRRGKSVLAAGCSAVAMFPVPRVCTDTNSRRQSVGDFSTDRRRPRAELIAGPRWPGGPWPLIDGRALVRIQTLIETWWKARCLFDRTVVYSAPTDRAHCLHRRAISFDASGGQAQLPLTIPVQKQEVRSCTEGSASPRGCL
jgi:hypothetical protein